MTNDGMEGTAKLGQGKGVRRSPVEDEKCFAVGFKNLAHPIAYAVSPLVLAVGNLRVGVRCDQSVPSRRTNGRGVIAGEFESLLWRTHRAFPYATSRRGAIPFRDAKGQKRSGLARTPVLRRVSARPILYLRL